MSAGTTQGKNADTVCENKFVVDRFDDSKGILMERDHDCIFFNSISSTLVVSLGQHGCSKTI